MDSMYYDGRPANDIYASLHAMFFLYIYSIEYYQKQQRECISVYFKLPKNKFQISLSILYCLFQINITNNHIVIK